MFLLRRSEVAKQPLRSFRCFVDLDPYKRKSQQISKDFNFGDLRNRNLQKNIVIGYRSILSFDIRIFKIKIHRNVFETSKTCSIHLFDDFHQVKVHLIQEKFFKPFMNLLLSIQLSKIMFYFSFHSIETFASQLNVTQKEIGFGVEVIRQIFFLYSP